MTMLSALANFLKGAPPLDALTRQSLTRVGAVVDPLILDVRSFERRLVAPVQHAQAYCAALVDALPGPLTIERRAFVTEPLVHALFATGNDIGEMLGKSQAARDFLDETESYTSEYFYALFAARRVEKHQLGVEVHGETIQSEVPQTVLYFADHTLTEPAASVEAAKARLQAATFDSLLKTFRSHLDALRAEREGMRSHISAERSHLVAIKAKGEGDAVFVQSRRIETLDQKLRELADTLMPESIVEALAAHLLAPEASLRLEPCSFTVDRMGVLAQGEAGSDNVDTIEFPELISRDRRRYLVTLARIHCDDARRSVKEALDRQRRYVLI